MWSKLRANERAVIIGIPATIITGLTVYYLTTGRLQSAKAPPEATPAPVAVATPSPAATPVPRQTKLIYRDHFNGGTFWEVQRTNPDMASVSNDQFKAWSIPFDTSRYVIHSNREVAGDEVFKEPENWWAAPPYNLPKLRKTWLEILDDERWYIYEVTPR